jgi:hypothetical protein
LRREQEVGRAVQTASGHCRVARRSGIEAGAGRILEDRAGRHRNPVEIQRRDPGGVDSARASLFHLRWSHMSLILKFRCVQLGRRCSTPGQQTIPEALQQLRRELPTSTLDTDGVRPWWQTQIIADERREATRLYIQVTSTPTRRPCLPPPSPIHSHMPISSPP